MPDFDSNIVVVADADRAEQLRTLLGTLLADTRVGVPGGAVTASPTARAVPPAVSLFFQIRAESREAARESLDGVVAGIVAAGESISAPSKILGVHKGAPAIDVPQEGLRNDEAARVLIIDTWAPGWANVEVVLVARSDDQVTALVSTGNPRQDLTFVVRKLIIRRPAE